MRAYEVMLILPAEADDGAIKGAVDRVSRVIGETDGTVTNVDTWGRRRLAHQIDKRTEGSYVVVDMSADPTVIVELERVLHLADDVIRFKVMAKPPERKRRGPAKAKASASNGSAETAVPEAEAAPAEAEAPEAEADAAADAQAELPAASQAEAPAEAGAAPAAEPAAENEARQDQAGS
jgi:small subunit ribosomal protein S6